MSAAAPHLRDRVAARAAAATPVRESQEPVGQQRNGSHQHANEERETDVEVADVAHLVPDDALELLSVELVEQAGGHRHARVFRVTPGGEGIRRRVVDDPQPRGRQAARQAHLLDDVDQLPERFGWVRAVDLSSPLVAITSASPGNEEPTLIAHRDHQRQDEPAPAEAGRIPDRAAEQAEDDDHHHHQ